MDYIKPENGYSEITISKNQLSLKSEYFKFKIINFKKLT